jgi:Tfp pilus assembly PilM family ATPase
MWKWFKRKPPVCLIGVDYKPDMIKLAEITSENGLQYIHSCLEARSLSEMAVLLKKQPVKTRETVIALPDTAVMIKTLPFGPKLKKRDLHKHIELEAEHYFGYPAETLSFDYTNNDEKVTVVAAKRHEIDMRRNALKTLGLKVIAVDVESHAIARGAQLHFYRNTALAYGHNTAVFLIAQREQQFSGLQESIESEDMVTKKIGRMRQLLLETHSDVRIDNIAVLKDDVHLSKLLDLDSPCPVRIINPVQEMLVAERCKPYMKKYSEWVISCGLALRQFS